MTSDTTDLLIPVGTEDENLRLSSQIASINLLFAQKELGQRITDPNITTKGLLEIAEHSYKVSGMAKKQEAKTAGPAFSITINIPQADGGERSVVIGESSIAEVQDEVAALVDESITLFGEPPEFVRNFPEDDDTDFSRFID